MDGIPQEQLALETYEKDLAAASAADTRAWAELMVGGRIFVTHLQNREYDQASALVNLLGDKEYELACDCEATSQLAESCGGYYSQDGEWLFGEDAVERKKLEDETPTKTELESVEPLPLSSSDKLALALEELTVAALRVLADRDPSTPHATELHKALQEACTKAKELLRVI